MKCKDKKCANELPSYVMKQTFCEFCRKCFGEYMRKSNDKLINREYSGYTDKYTFAKFKDSSGNYV